MNYTEIGRVEDRLARSAAVWPLLLVLLYSTVGCPAVERDTAGARAGSHDGGELIATAGDARILHICEDAQIGCEASIPGEDMAPGEAMATLPLAADGQTANAMVQVLSRGSHVALDSGTERESGPNVQCTSTIHYGLNWLQDPLPNPSGQVKTFNGEVAWDGACRTGFANSSATMFDGSRSWVEYFNGNTCAVQIDYSDGCTDTTLPCTTRVSYGANWIPGPNHPNHYDDVAGVVTWDGECISQSHPLGLQSTGVLSNGWRPGFAGGTCELSFRYTNCSRQVVQNPVVPNFVLQSTGCRDPGTIRVGNDYYMVCTGGSGFMFHASGSLDHWDSLGPIPFTARPMWWSAEPDFWAPEIHLVASTYVLVYSARRDNGRHVIGAATASSPAGPYEDKGILVNADIDQYSAIDPTIYNGPIGGYFIAWKLDANGGAEKVLYGDGSRASNPKTPNAPASIWAQSLSADLKTSGLAHVLLSADSRSWEGTIIEAPSVVFYDGAFYMFYSGSIGDSYSISVAVSKWPLGEYLKIGRPIVQSRGPVRGPGHCSVLVDGYPRVAIVYHANRVVLGKSYTLYESVPFVGDLVWAEPVTLTQPGGGSVVVHWPALDEGSGPFVGVRVLP